MSVATIYNTIEALLIYGAAASLIFLVGFLWVARGSWWRRLTGVAILISAVALVLLLNLEIALALLDAGPYADAVVTCVVLGVICAGITFKIAALAYEWRHGRKDGA